MKAPLALEGRDEDHGGVPIGDLRRPVVSTVESAGRGTGGRNLVSLTL